MKDLLLCALSTNAEKLESTYYWNSRGTCTAFKFKDIVIFKDTKDSLQDVYGKYFWQMSTKVIREELFKIHYGDEKIDITEQEYNEIITLYQERIREEQLKTLKKLCKSK